ncbi:hypothetical protein [Nocardia arizonensis]|uniref:hypothetical protein n=1 Tax=Nocardia arizonensis TaxID=1141647 RepID=UPI0006D15723|nr:hypothetical protein [Nocardia arizonensis]
MGCHSTPEDPTQVRFPWRAVLRTALSVVIGTAAAMPMIVAASGLPDTAAGVGTLLGVSAAVTRVLAVPAVNLALARWAPWLAAEPRQ